jgi:hypothetical protein
MVKKVQRQAATSHNKGLGFIHNEDFMDEIIEALEP